MIIYHVRNAKRQRVGTLVAEKITKENQSHIVIGWSKCNRKDRFNRKTGIALAQKRIDKKRTKTVIPNGVREHVVEFIDRAKKYFKEADVMVTGCWK